MTNPSPPHDFVDNDEDVPDDELPDWDQWIADLDAAGEAFDQ